MTDIQAIEMFYREHLDTYPSLDYAWGLLFRNAVEKGDLDEVNRLMAPPFSVPDMVGFCARAYVFSLTGDVAQTAQELEHLLDAEQAATHWVWAWEFAIEASTAPGMGRFRETVQGAALSDGYMMA
jgi:hypothetical protein